VLKPLKPKIYLVLVLLAGLLSGCASDAIHLAQLDAGMTRAQVEQVQGKADKVETSGDYTALRYGNDFQVILRGDRVIAFGPGTLSQYPGTHRYFINESYP
jgi:hypothetical protein